MNETNEIKDEKNILGKISNFFIERYRVVYLILIMLVLIGGLAYVKLPREEAPEVELPYVNIMTTYAGASPNEIETLITDKIESKISGMEDIKKISSASKANVSSITIEYEIGIDVDKKIQDINNEIAKVKNELPEDSDEPFVRKWDIGKLPIMTLNVSGDYDLVTLKNIAENIRDEIEKIDGIQEVNLIGGLDREIHIYMDEAKLNTYGLTINDIKNTIAKSNINFPGGEIELDDINYNIRTVASFDEIEENVMGETPRQKGEPILNNQMKKLIAFYAVIMDVTLLALFYYFWRASGNLDYARTITFVGLGLTSLFYIYSVRGLKLSILHINPFSNKLLNFATVGGLLLFIIALYIPFFNRILHTIPLGATEWLVLGGYVIMSIIVYETGKKLTISNPRR